MKNITQNELIRFNSSIIKINNCWEWSKKLDKDGYGTFFWRRKLRRAHRVSYFFYKGMIKEGLVIHHECGNKKCVNPNHLKQVTPLENRRLSLKEFCKNGHNFDRKYGKQRYCSICQAVKTKRLRAKWKLNIEFENI